MIPIKPNVKPHDLLPCRPLTYQATVHTFAKETSGLTFNNTEPPPGAVILDDPYKVYLCSTLENCDISCLMATKESSSLHTVLPLVNHNLYVESILNPGSQVISMSEEACHVLGLIYDPQLRLHMQSVNSEADETLGLAQNVPMLLGEIMFYVQFHIIRNPMYDILLGRPFDVLLGSIVHNYKNEDQTITIHDPNSGRTTTVPTFVCSTHP